MQEEPTAAKMWNFIWKAACSGSISWVIKGILDKAFSRPSPGGATVIASFLSSSAAPLWFIGAGILSGLVWAAWPEIARKAVQKESNESSLQKTPPQEYVLATDAYIAKITKEELDTTKKKLARVELELMACTQRLSEKLPKIEAAILEILAGDLIPGCDDLRIAIIMGISNGGKRSILHKFKVTAHTIGGVEIVADVPFCEKFSLTMNDGRDYVDYFPEHYIFERTTTPIEDGCPVIGVLPCTLREIKELKEVNLLSFRVAFFDCIAHEDGKSKQWESNLLQPGEMKRIVTPMYRPGLPFIRPVA